MQGFSAPIPPGTPDHETGSHTVPGTGPYKIVAVASTQVRFARNAFFHEWSHAAQPAGNPDVIVWRSLPSSQDAVTAIEHGRADWLYGLIPAAQYAQLSLQAAAQLHSSPEFVVDFIHLNTHLAPFSNVLVRQALNYAINRGAIVQMYGGPSFATPTCQPLTPGVPGYSRYCPYTLDPSPDGAWSAPDLAKARHLVERIGNPRRANHRIGCERRTLHPPRGTGVHRRGPALARLPRRASPTPQRQDHAANAQA